MKHSEDYIEAKYLIEHQMGFDPRDILVAQAFVRGYEQALIVAGANKEYVRVKKDGKHYDVYTLSATNCEGEKIEIAKNDKNKKQ